jgi:signal transduction histidine kinase
VESVIDIFRTDIEQKQLQISLRFKQIADVLSIDTELFNLILYNLLSNAIKYTRERDQITIKLQILDYAHLRENLSLFL